MSTRVVAALSAVALVVSGCAVAPPNTPGAGSGDTYTPFVDLHGVDQARYQSDLAGCRSYAQQIDAGAEAMKGMIGGIIVGALIGAAIGGNSRSAQYGATAGGGAGVGGAAGKAINKQETVISNCLAGRGYRVLEGATVPTNTAVASPYLPVAPSAAVAGAPAGQPSIVQTSMQPTTSASAAPMGQDGYNAGRAATASGCHQQPSPVLAAKGPGYESYTVACANGDSIMIRCEFGNCRVLR